MRRSWKKWIFLEVAVIYVLVLCLCMTPSAGLSAPAISPDASDPYEDLPKQVALTFDDGPHPVYTPELLDGLKKREVKATFFVTGEHAQENPELVQRIHQEGHLIGNHTYSHIQLRANNREEFKAELTRTQEILEELTGERVQYVRPPYGTWEKSLEQELDMFPILWDVDPLDWCSSDAGCITRKVLGQVEEGSMILMHDQYPASIKAALEIVDILQDQGYEFVTVEELLLQ